MKKLGYIILMTIAILVSIYWFTQPYYIYSDGMEPDIKNGDIVLLKKHPKNYGVNDIVIYENGVELVGKIVAIPGDTITVENNKLYVNSQFIADYVFPNTEHILEEEYLVLNNENFGYIIKSEQIKGEVR